MYYPSETVTTRDERFFASEIVRECLLKLYKVRHALATALCGVYAGIVVGSLYSGVLCGIA